VQKVECGGMKASREEDESSKIVRHCSSPREGNARE